MGKRSKDRITQELDQPDEGLSDIPIISKSKKRKNKTFPDDGNPEISVGDENNCKKPSSEVLGDKGHQSYKTKIKNPSNHTIDSTVSDQEVFSKPKKQKKEDIEEHTDSLDNASRNKKKKKKRKSDVEKEDGAQTGEFENITPSHIEETKRTKKLKPIPLDSEIETSVNSDTDKLLRKKKRKIAVEIVEETERKDECLDVADVDTKTKKKKKKHHLENEHEDIVEKSNKNLNPTQESTNKEKKSKVTENELGADSAYKKIKPVTAKFNAEEAAVTEEEINQFCDEIDEEDNKQYEDWVKLIEDMLGPKKRDVIES